MKRSCDSPERSETKAEPGPVRPLMNGVREVMGEGLRSGSEETHEGHEIEGQRRERHAPNERRLRQRLAADRAHENAPVPQRMAYAAEEMVVERPDEADQNDLSGHAIDDPGDGGIGAGSGGEPREINSEQRGAEIERDASDTMRHRHGHRQHHSVDSQMRRERTSLRETVAIGFDHGSPRSKTRIFLSVTS